MRVASKCPASSSRRARVSRAALRTNDAISSASPPRSFPRRALERVFLAKPTHRDSITIRSPSSSARAAAALATAADARVRLLPDPRHLRLDRFDLSALRLNVRSMTVHERLTRDEERFHALGVVRSIAG